MQLKTVSKMNKYEVNLTPLMGFDLWSLIGANLTHGEGAGKRAWLATQNTAKGLEILTDEQAAQFARMVRESGVEVDEQVEKSELVALFLQWVVNDLREIGFYEVADLLKIDGEVEGGNFFVADGVPYFQIS